MGHKAAGEDLVIDPDGDAYPIVKELSKSELRLLYILVTHSHIDHAGGAEDLKGITGAPVLIHPLDATSLSFKPDGSLCDGQEISLGSYQIFVLHTPGHSPGGVSFHAPGAVFTGDTVFSGSISWTDFPGGDQNWSIAGVTRKIFPLEDDLRVYPGHGPATTIGRERLNNPFFPTGQKV